MGLVGLYACIVRRLRTEKRNSAYFLGFIGFLGLLRLLWLLCVVCLVIASLLFFVGCGCVVGGSFSLRMIATKERERRVGAPSLCSCVVCLFIGS